MKTFLTALVLSATAIAVTAPADAKGCIKGAIVGGIAGHMAGHGAAGAAAGCAIGHHHANKMDKKAQDSGASGTGSSDAK